MRLSLATGCLRVVLMAFVGLSWLSVGTLGAAQDLPVAGGAALAEPLPETLGQIVYQTQGAAASRIYIIANAHRSALSGVNNPVAVQAQLETYRIGEWLISRREVDLLLPEGFLGRLEDSAAAGAAAPLDNLALRASLEDTAQFVNAELLLHRNYGIKMEQIEDRSLYSRARERLRASFGSGSSRSGIPLGELSYLQKLRTAAILQNIPAAIDDAYRQGRISAPNAMLTIGMSHLADIVAFLEAGAIRIASLHTGQEDFPGQDSELNLLKQKVGVTVIVPRSLVARL